MAVAVARLPPLRDIARVVGKAPQKGELDLVERRRVGRPQQKDGPAPVLDRTEVHQRALARLAQPGQPVPQGRPLAEPHHGRIGSRDGGAPAGRLELVEAHRQRSVARHGQRRDDGLALVGVLAQGYHRAVERLGEQGGDLCEGVVLRHCAGRGSRILRTASVHARPCRPVRSRRPARRDLEKQTAQLRAEFGQLCRTLATQRREGAGNLDREVATHRVEQAGVVLARLPRAVPPDLDHGDRVPAEPHGSQKEARKRRELAGRDAPHHAGVLVDDLPARQAPPSQVGRGGLEHAQAQRTGRPLEAHPKRQVSRQRGALQGRAHPVQMKPTALGKVEQGARRLHRARDFLDHVGEEAPDVLGVDRAQDDVKRARQAAVGALQLVEQTVVLTPGRIGIVCRRGDEQIGLPRRVHAVGAHDDLGEPSVAPRAHDVRRAAVERERQGRRHKGVIRRDPQCRREIQAHVAARHVRLAAAEQLGRLVVGQQHPTRTVKYEYGVAGHRQKTSEGTAHTALTDTLAGRASCNLCPLFRHLSSSRTPPVRDPLYPHRAV